MVLSSVCQKHCPTLQLPHIVNCDIGDFAQETDALVPRNCQLHCIQEGSDERVMGPHRIVRKSMISRNAGCEKQCTKQLHKLCRASPFLIVLAMHSCGQLCNFPLLLMRSSLKSERGERVGVEIAELHVFGPSEPLVTYVPNNASPPGRYSYHGIMIFHSCHLADVTSFIKKTTHHITCNVRLNHYQRYTLHPIMM